MGLVTFQPDVVPASTLPKPFRQFTSTSAAPAPPTTRLLDIRQHLLNPSLDADFLWAAIRDQGALVLSLLPHHQVAVQVELVKFGLDIDASLKEGSLVLLDSSVSQFSFEFLVSSLSPHAGGAGASGSCIADGLDPSIASLVAEALIKYPSLTVITDLGRDIGANPEEGKLIGLSMTWALDKDGEKENEKEEMSFSIPQPGAAHYSDDSSDGTSIPDGEIHPVSSALEHATTSTSPKLGKRRERNPSAYESMQSLQQKFIRLNDDADAMDDARAADEVNMWRSIYPNERANEDESPEDSKLFASMRALSTRNSLIDILSPLSTGFLCISFPLFPCLEGGSGNTEDAMLEADPNSSTTSKKISPNTIQALRQRYAERDIGITATPSLFTLFGLDPNEDLGTLEWVEKCIHPEDCERLIEFLFGQSVPAGHGPPSISSSGSGGSAGAEGATSSTSTAPPQIQPPRSPVQQQSSIALVRVQIPSSAGNASHAEEPVQKFVAAVRAVRREWDGSRRRWVSTFACLPLNTVDSGDCSNSSDAGSVDPKPSSRVEESVAGAHNADANAVVAASPIVHDSPMTRTGSTPTAIDAASSFAPLSFEPPQLEVAEQAKRESERFARVIGRELRDPLTGILGCIGLFEQSLGERKRMYSQLESAFLRAKRVVSSAAESVEAAFYQPAHPVGLGLEHPPQHHLYDHHLHHHHPQSSAPTNIAQASSSGASSYPSPRLEPIPVAPVMIPNASLEDNEDMPSLTITPSSTDSMQDSPNGSFRAMTGFRDAGLIEAFKNYLEEDMMSIAAIAECVDRSRSVIDDVLDLSRMDANRMRLFPHRVDPKRILTEVARRLAPKALDRGVRLRLNLPVDDIWISVDPIRFEQAVTNMVNFSVLRACNGEDWLHAEHLEGVSGMSMGGEGSASTRSAPPSEKVVTLGLDAYLSPEGSLWITVTSQDNGQTLTEDEYSGLFDRSSIIRNHPAAPASDGTSSSETAAQVVEAMSVSPEAISIGPALGLLVSKRLAELMGGVVRAMPGPVPRHRSVSISSSILGKAATGQASDEGVDDDEMQGAGGRKEMMGSLSPVAHFVHAVGTDMGWRGALLSLTIPSAPLAS
ncbi:hypothetical protein HDU97_006731 [Phlyctochytrium planicorne]|nr:hypothetical protein HDU97_006731 [Phlyctochytrium planicorne]